MYCIVLYRQLLISYSCLKLKNVNNAGRPLRCRLKISIHHKSRHQNQDKNLQNINTSSSIIKKQNKTKESNKNTLLSIVSFKTKESNKNTLLSIVSFKTKESNKNTLLSVVSFKGSLLIQQCFFSSFSPLEFEYLGIIVVILLKCSRIFLCLACTKVLFTKLDKETINLCSTKTNNKDNACMIPLKLEGMHITVNVHYSMYNAYKLNLFKS